MLIVQEAWTKAFVTTGLMFFADYDMKQGMCVCSLLEYIIVCS